MITAQPLKFSIQVLFAKVRINLINNPRMFNLGIDDLAEKPYIPQKIYFYEFVANVLHDDIGILIVYLH